MSVKTVAWKFARRYGSGLSFVEPEAPKGLTDDEFTEPQALVLRSDYESLESRLQQAEQALRELVNCADAAGPSAFPNNPAARWYHAWAAARAIAGESLEQ